MSYEQMNPDPLITFHCDGRVTVSDKLKPEETAKLVLDIMKTQWMDDMQASKIRELQDWKESALAVEREWNANAIATMLGGKPGESQRKVIQREVPRLLDRIKRLEDEVRVLRLYGNKDCTAQADAVLEAKEAKP